MISIAVLREQKDMVLQSKDGYFLRFSLEEIPEKKKGAIGVRGMRLSEQDVIEAVYYTENMTDTVVPYRNKSLELHKLRSGKRDTKGVKVRV